jgi:hypothetical protein
VLSTTSLDFAVALVSPESEEHPVSTNAPAATPAITTRNFVDVRGVFISLVRSLDDLVPHLTKALLNKAELPDFLVERHIRWFNQMGAIRKDNNGNIGSTTDTYCARFVLGVGVNIEIFIFKAELVKLCPRAYAVSTPTGTVHTDHWHEPPSQQGWI